MTCRLRLSIPVLACSLILLFSPSAPAQEPLDSTEQDSIQNVTRSRLDQVLDDVLNTIERVMERYWGKEETVERNDSLILEEEDAVYPETRYEERFRDRRRRERVRRMPESVSYPLHWSARITEMDLFLFRYNRVEGIFLGLGSPKRYYWDGEKRFSTYGSIGYGFKTHRWQYSFGVDRWFFNRYRFEIGAEGHSIVDTKDNWFIGIGENNLAALFVRQDYHDHFRKDGFSVHAAQYMTQVARLRVDYVVDKYRSLPRNTEWSLFGGKRRFRQNPAIDDGMMRSVIVSLDLNNVVVRRGRTQGWNIHASTEFAGGNLGGDFTFNRYLLEVRRAQPLSQYDKLNVRLRVGSSHGTLPIQKSFELGGMGTLNAYSYKEFSGNRMILGNLEYIFSGSVLDELAFWPSGLFSRATFILFADVGMTSVARTDQNFLQGFGKLSGNQWKSSVGVAFGSRDGTSRLAFAWRTDGRGPVKIFLRLQRPF